MLSIYTRAWSECHYPATRFLQLLSERGGLGTAHYLLGTSEPSYRFAALWESKRLDLTVEALVLENPEWAIFFPKRSNKGGSWMKGHIRQRGKGSRALALDLGRSEEGKRRQKWISGFKTKRDAERELARVIHEMNTGAYLEPSKMTVGDYLKRWIEDYARPNVAPKTFERYVKIVRLHLTPALGSHPLGKLQPLHIQAYYSQALQSGRRDGKGELAAQTHPAPSQSVTRSTRPSGKMADSRP